jgi:hypothetical protein
MTATANEAELRRLEARASIAQARLSLAIDWNLGARGNYIGVSVANDAHGREAVIREVGFTVAATAKLEALSGHDYAPGEPEEALAYPSLPIPIEERPIRAGQVLRFRVPLARLPWFWDEDTEIYPYIYYDEGRWLIGQSARLAGLLRDHGWTDNPNEKSMFPIMTMDYVWPDSVSGLRARFDLLAGET